MVLRPRAVRPAEQAIRLGDRHVVDAGVADRHVALGVELPVLVAVRAPPLPGGVVPFVGEAHRDAVVAERPQLLDEPVLELLGPLALDNDTDCSRGRATRI